MLYMLDTNICSYILKEHPLSVKDHFDKIGPDALSISTIVLAELYYGAVRHPKGTAIRKDIDDFAGRILIIPWDQAAADHYGILRSGLEKTGKPIGSMDMLIAAHARSIRATLVSNNTRHFEKVPDLLIAKWF